MLTAGVGSLDAKTGAGLVVALQQTGLVQAVTEFDLRAETLPASESAVPDVLLVDLGRDPTVPLRLAEHLHGLRPSVCIIACSAVQQPGPQLLMQAMRSGVREFLTQPIDPLALRAMLERLVKERRLVQTAAEKLILVMGSKGGVGTTTVAVNLGVQLAQITEQQVALLDFGRPLGHAVLMLDLQPRFFLRDAVENLERLDNHFLRGLLTAHKSGLQVLAGTTDPDEWERLSVSGLARVLNVAQSSFDYVLADLGTIYSSEWTPVLRLARLVILVAQTDVPALWSLEHHLSTLRSLGLNADRFRMIINRWHRSDEEALKPFEKKVDRPIFARLPNDFRQVSEAVNLGTALSRNHNDPLVSKFRHLAAEFAGLGPESEDKRWSIRGLFSFQR
jgi:pilus assembly protein CpaE